MTDYPKRWINIMSDVPEVGQFVSPLKLVQEAVGGDDDDTRGWRIVLASMMCCRTPRDQSHPAAWKILRDWPYPHNLAFGSNDTRRRLVSVCKPCGFQNRRADDLIMMSKNWVMGLRPPEIHGAGEYVTDAYRLFFNGEYRHSPRDKELAKFVMWVLAERRRARETIVELMEKPLGFTPIVPIKSEVRYALALPNWASPNRACAEAQRDLWLRRSKLVDSDRMDDE